jgi:hypothetical protein
MNAVQLNGMQHEDVDMNMLESMNPQGDSMLSQLESFSQGVQDFPALVKTANLSIDAVGIGHGISSGDFGAAFRSALGIMDEFLDLQNNDPDMDADEDQSFMAAPSMAPG